MVLPIRRGAEHSGLKGAGDGLEKLASIRAGSGMSHTVSVHQVNVLILACDDGDMGKGAGLVRQKNRPSGRHLERIVGGIGRWLEIVSHGDHVRRRDGRCAELDKGAGIIVAPAGDIVRAVAGGKTLVKQMTLLR